MTGPPRCILLVGGSSEIGLAIVRAVVERGGSRSIVLAGRHMPVLETAADHLRAGGHSVHTLSYDAAWSAPVTADFLRQAQATAGALDLVVVAVGTLHPPCQPSAEPHPPLGPEHPSPAEPGLEEMLQTNLVGPAVVANEVADLLCRQRHGHLVVVTSAVAVRPRGQLLGYAVAKQALDTFVRGLDARTRGNGVRCVVVRPGRVQTRMTAGLPPVPGTARPEQVGARVRTALRKGSSVVWAPAAVGPATTLLRMTPDRALPRSLR